MTYLIYNIIITIFVIVYFPFHCIRILFFPKHRRSTLPRLGFQKVPHFNKNDIVYWLHAVSVGEINSIKELVQEIKKNEPNSKVVISTITETGQNEARKITQADAIFYYPIDIYFVINKLVKTINPTFLIIVETDLWANLLQICYKRGVKIFLVNGKLSKTSARRYKKIPSFVKLLLTPFFHIFSQTETYSQRFLEIGVAQEKISTVGNLKLDIKPPISTDKEKEKMLLKYGLSKEKPLVIFASTHSGEDELAIELFKQIDIQLVLAPRHPERFKKVGQLLKGLDEFNKFSDFQEEPLPSTSFLLLDTLGQLMKFYEIGDLAIIAGSFNKKIGGHNIFEPAFYKKPFIYGSYLFKQPGLEQLAKDYQAGIQCSSDELVNTVQELLKDKDKMQELGEAGYQAIQPSKELVKKVYQLLKS